MLRGCTPRRGNTRSKTQPELSSRLCAQCPVFIWSIINSDPNELRTTSLQNCIQAIRILSEHAAALYTGAWQALQNERREPLRKEQALLACSF